VATVEGTSAVTVAPVLRTCAAHGGAGRVWIVGPEFQRGHLAFALPLGSPLRRMVDGALLAIRAGGTTQRIHEKWFGKE
jgi:polar amino acid transport system substrate-binding protein